MMDYQTKPAVRAGRNVSVAATGREHLVTVLLGLWMTVGLFMDGYFHQNLAGDAESFVTPWHAVFYGGFAASAWWLATISGRQAAGSLDWRLRFLPRGYEGARAGLVLFALGGAGDAAWHTAFGVERGVDALLSPTHLMLFAGLVLILTAPLRAALAAPESPPSPWILVGSVTSATALIGFFLNFVWGLGIAGFARVVYDPISEAGETQVIAGVASMLVTTIVFFGAAKVILSGDRPPVGALTVLFGTVALLVSLAFDEDAEGVAAAIVAGVALETLLRVPSSPGNRVGGLPAVFGVASTVLWLTYLGALSALDGIEWPAEIWLGAIVLSGLTAYAIAALPSFGPLPPGRSGEAPAGAPLPR